jgi:transcription elongation GreA/GreB family factor
VTIVLPGDIKNRNDVSVYSPIGLACLGAKEKDFVNIKFKNATQRLFIEKIVFQPEKEKLLYL